MSLKETLEADQKRAMKERDKQTLSTLRMVTAAIKNAEIEAQGALSDADVERIIARQVKQLQDSIKDFAAGGRDDLLARAKVEEALLASYLPEQLSDEELADIVAATVNDLGAASPADMGKVMGAVMGKVNGRADGNRVRAAVQNALST